MKPLIIPERFRKTRQGYYVFCYKCKKNITTKCGTTGKRIHTCNNPESHRFQSKWYDPIKKRMVLMKTWPKSLRDIHEFFRLHSELIKNKPNEDSIMIENKPGLLSGCLAYYGDFINDEGVASYEKKNNSIKYIKNQLTNLKHMKTALIEKEIDPDHLVITDFSSSHVSIIHDYLGRFSNRTYNDKIGTFRAFFKFLQQRNYDVKNVFDSVKPKPTKASTDIVTLDLFAKLCEICTYENGMKFEKKGEGRIGRKNFYRPFLTDVWKFALYSGCRPEEVANAKFKDIKENHLLSKNYKVTRLKKMEVIRLIPLTQELKELLDFLKDRDGLTNEDFILAPQETNRVQMIRLASNAFSHYWPQVSNEKRVFYDLRNTYATAMISKVGAEFRGRVGLHKNLITTIENYQNEQSVLSDVYGTRLFR